MSKIVIKEYAEAALVYVGAAGARKPCCWSGKNQPNTREFAVDENRKTGAQQRSITMFAMADSPKILILVIGIVNVPHHDTVLPVPLK
jgi:hypothetical protein